VAVPHADIQDRDGLALVLDRGTRRLFPSSEHIHDHGGYQGTKAATAAPELLANRSSTALLRM
jgi:hypothetical protein